VNALLVPKLRLGACLACWLLAEPCSREAVALPSRHGHFKPPVTPRAQTPNTNPLGNQKTPIRETRGWLANNTVALEMAVRLAERDV
jgi:hypothetical protein